VPSGLYARLCHAFSSFYLFLSNSPTGHIIHHIFTFNVSNDADQHKSVPLTLLPFRGLNCPTKTILKVWIGIFQPNMQNNIFATGWLILMKFGWIILTLYSPWENKISQFQKCKMAVASILKIWKIEYLCNWWSDFEEIWQWRNWHIQPIKFCHFENPRWRWRPSWKFKKPQ